MSSSVIFDIISGAGNNWTKKTFVIQVLEAFLKNFERDFIV